jgi:hypothetical protein
MLDIKKCWKNAKDSYLIVALQVDPTIDRPEKISLHNQ